MGLSLCFYVYYTKYGVAVICYLLFLEIFLFLFFLFPYSFAATLCGNLGRCSRCIIMSCYQGNRIFKTNLFIIKIDDAVL